MKILLTNDDGIDAPGLLALAQAAAGLGDLYWVAPDDHLSGCGHRVTTDSVLNPALRTAGRWAVNGTPADCVRLGLAHLVAEVEWVLSGINHGGNLGADVYHSGTVAAAREAALHGRPSIALSQYRKRGVEVDWSRAIGWLTQVIPTLFASSWKPGMYWNVNLPSLRADDPEPSVIYCPLEGGPLPIRFRQKNDGLIYDGNYHERRRRPGSDVDVCFSGNIAVTVLSVDI